MHILKSNGMDSYENKLIALIRTIANSKTKLATEFQSGGIVDQAIVHNRPLRAKDKVMLEWVVGLRFMSEEDYNMIVKFAGIDLWEFQLKYLNKKP